MHTDALVLLIASLIVALIAWMTVQRIRTALRLVPQGGMPASDWIWVFVVVGLMVLGAVVGASPIDLPIGKLFRWGDGVD